MGDVVRFRVLKGTKFLFECEVTRAEALPTALQHHVVRANEMSVLRDTDIAITKRLNLVEVDRMVACCRQHPPQALVEPVKDKDAKTSTAFEEFAAYLKQRERAGVGSINPGMLVLLIPLEHRNDTMRCQIVNTKATVAEIGAQLSSAFAPTADQGAQSGASIDEYRVTASGLVTTSTAAVNEANNQANNHTDSVADIATTSQHKEGDGGRETPVQDDCDPFKELRQEYAAFNAFYHHVLLEWSTKPSDMDSVHELRRHT